MRITTAFHAFFAALFHRGAAEKIQDALKKKPLVAIESAIPESSDSKEKKPKRTASPGGQSEAITLLSALQREARFLDFIQESIEQYSDAQIGAAARSVHDQCAKTLHRFFAPEPLVNKPEDSSIEVSGENFAQFQLIGNINQSPPFSGRLVHSGWKATKVEIPLWNGQPEHALILAPAELEIE